MDEIEVEVDGDTCEVWRGPSLMFAGDAGKAEDAIAQAFVDHDGYLPEWAEVLAEHFELGTEIEFTSSVRLDVESVSMAANY